MLEIRQDSSRTFKGADIDFHLVFEKSPNAIFLETIRGELIECNQAACDLFGYSSDELVQKNLAVLIPQAAAFTLPLLMSGTIENEAYGKRKDGAIFPIQIQSHLVQTGSDSLALVFIQDISERKGYEKYFDSSTKINHAFHKTAHALVTTQALAELLQAIADNLAQAISANCVSLAVLDDRKQQITNFIVGGPGAKLLDIPTYREITETVQSIEVDELLSKLLKNGSNGKKAAIPDWKPGHYTTDDHTMFVPITYRDRLLGVLGALKRSKQPEFTEQDEAMLIATAAQLALAIQYFQTNGFPPGGQTVLEN